MLQYEFVEKASMLPFQQSTPEDGGNDRKWAPIPLEELTGGGGKNNGIVPNCTYPYVPVSDSIEDSDPYAGGRKIPRYIHVSHKSRCLHHLQALSLEKWKQALPNYSVFYHDDDAVERLIHGEDNWPEFPHLRKIIQCAQMKGAMLCDIWRVLVLYRYGGLYSDIDIWPGPKFTEDTIPAEVDFFSLSDGWDRPSQWLFALSPGHPAGYYTMIEILERVLKMPNIADTKLVFTTGPDALKWGYAKAFHWDKDRIFGDGVFSGQYNTTARKIGKGNVNGYVATNMNDNIVVNATFNMSVREKIKSDTGNLHWLEAQHSIRIKGPQIPCHDYLYSLERQSKSFPHANSMR